jgi:hypothetical protein
MSAASGEMKDTVSMFNQEWGLWENNRGERIIWTDDKHPRVHEVVSETFRGVERTNAEGFCPLFCNLFLEPI